MLSCYNNFIKNQLIIIAKENQMSVSCLKKKPISTDKAPKAIGPYSAAVSTDQMVFTSGQLGMDPASGALVKGGIQAQTRQALTNLKFVLEAGDTNLDNVVKVTVFLQDMGEFSLMNEVYAEFFKKDCPARSAVQVAALPKNAAVEIEAIAIIPYKDADYDCHQEK